MSVYAARMKRNLRETIEERDAILRRIELVREGLKANVEYKDGEHSVLMELLHFIETGDVSTGYKNLMKEVH